MCFVMIIKTNFCEEMIQVDPIQKTKPLQYKMLLDESEAIDKK
jgi:hypothetical protein